MQVGQRLGEEAASLVSAAGGVRGASGPAHRGQAVPSRTSSRDASQSGHGSCRTPASPHRLHTRGSSHSTSIRPEF